MKKIIILIGVILLFVASFIFWQPQETKVNKGQEFVITIFETPLDEKRSVVKSYYDELGPNAMLDALEVALPDCHYEAHDIGKEIYSRTKNIHTSIEICERRCTDACFHGIMMELFDEELTTEANEYHEHADEVKPHLHADIKSPAVLEKLVNLCEDPSITNKLTCIHAAGHAVSIMTSDDLTVGQDVCTEIYNDVISQMYCTSGVFMQRDMDYGEEDFNNYGDQFPCDEHTNYPAMCYTFKIVRLRNHHDYTNDQIISLCQNLSNPAQRNGCFFGYGFYNSSLIKDAPQEFVNVCTDSALNADDQQSCIEGGSLNYALADEQKTRIACDLFSEKLKNICHSAADVKMYNYEHDYTRYLP